MAITFLTNEDEARLQSHINNAAKHTAHFGVPYSSAAAFFDISSDSDGSVYLYLFATAAGYDAVVVSNDSNGVIADYVMTYKEYSLTDGGTDTEQIGTYDDSYNKTDTRPFKEYVHKINRLYIEKGVTSIGDYFMHEAYNLRVLTFEDSKTVTHLGKYAFSQTLIDGEYDFPGLADTEIDNVFSVCKKLHGVTFSSTVTTIKGRSFEKCTSLRYVHGLSGVTSIENAAFQYCTSLENIDVTLKKATLGKWVFILTPVNAKVYETDTLLSDNDVWHEQGANCFIPNLWSEDELTAMREVRADEEEYDEKGKSIQVSIPESDNQSKPSYNYWLLYPQVYKGEYLGYAAQASNTCILFSLFHIYNASHPNAQYDTYYDFIKKEIQPRKFSVTQELYDALSADTDGQILLDRTGDKYNVGNEICATDLMYALSNGGNVTMGAAYWGICHALGWSYEKVPYRSEKMIAAGYSGITGAEAKRKLIEALMSGKLATISVSARSDTAGHAVAVMGYDALTDRFLLIDSSSPTPADIDKYTYWCAFEALTPINKQPYFVIVDFNNSSPGLPIYNGEIMICSKSNIQHYNREVVLL